MKNEQASWDKFYSSNDSARLPWTGIIFPTLLEQLDFTQKLIVTGCGVGDVVGQLYRKGFTQLIGTDLSSVAIETAKQRFPNLAFRSLSTESLPSYVPSYEWHRINILDWLVMHHIHPDNLSTYLGSLEAIAETVIIGYLYTPHVSTIPSAVKRNGLVYNHPLEAIIDRFRVLKLFHKSAFTIKTNPLFDNRSCSQGGILCLFSRKETYSSGY